ncbi:MAG TPA: ABC transporter substrate-binding protein [Hyphomicrobiaceae bacterium]|nr:ABC transporter substrate-binding protein [Hyphomicrobiaceae bacterium]
MSLQKGLRLAAALSAVLAWGAVALAGEITVYTALDADDAKVYVDAFEQEHRDIKVNLFRVSAGKLGAKIRAEAGNPRHDVIWGWTISEMERPDILAMTEPYRPKGIERVGARFLDPNGNWFATTGYFAALCVNTDLLRQRKLPVPERWADLTDPQYKGQIVMPSPLDSGTGYLQVAAWVQTMGGEAAWRYMSQLDRNIAQYTSSGSAPCKLARDKEYAIGITYAFAVAKVIDAFAEAKVDSPIELVIPREGAGYELEVSALMKSSANKGDARRFLDWLLGGRAVEIMNDRAEMNTITGTSRSRLARQVNMPTDVSTVFAAVDLKRSARDKEAITAQWKRDILDRRQIR